MTDVTARTLAESAVRSSPVPLAGTDAWLTVMEHAGYRCECTTCKSHHPTRQHPNR